MIYHNLVDNLNEYGTATYLLFSCRIIVKGKLSDEEREVIQELGRITSGPSNFKTINYDYDFENICFQGDCSNEGTNKCPACNEMLCDNHLDIYYKYLMTGVNEGLYLDNHYDSCMKLCCEENCYSRGLCYIKYDYDKSISNELKLERIKFYCLLHIPENDYNIIDIDEKKNVKEIEDIINIIIEIYDTVVIKPELGEVIMKIFECCKDFFISYSLMLNSKKEIIHSNHTKTDLINSEIEQIYMIFLEYYELVNKIHEDFEKEIDIDIKEYYQKCDELYLKYNTKYDNSFIKKNM